MADQNYQLFEYGFHNRGIAAKWITDDTPPDTYLSLGSCESREENALNSRLGPMMITTNGVNNVPLTDTNVHTLRRLRGLSATWRYAGAGTNLYRRTGDTNGNYTQINPVSLSGSRFSADVYRPNFSSFPYLFVADKSTMLKDNGTGNAQAWGILPPTIPAQTSLLSNAILDMAGFAFGGQVYSTINVGGFGQGTRLTGVTVAAAIATVGLNTVTPSSMANIMAGMFLVYDVGGANQESVQVISVTATTFTAFFTKTHPGAVGLQDVGYGGTVAANTTATVTKAGALNLNQLGGSPSPLTDFISLFINISDPSQVQQVQIMFDVGDGSFTNSYYLTTITANQFQSLISGTQTPNAALTQGVFARAAGQFSQPVLGHNFQPVLPPNGGNNPLPPFVPNPLLMGLNQWTLIQVQKGQFITVGQAGQPGHDWSAVNAWRIAVQTATTGALAFALDDFYLLGGSFLSSLGGIAYDYRYTYFNINTGSESNPSQAQIASLGLLSMNQPIQATWTAPTDPQVTHVRLYRRGGSNPNGWNLVSQVAIGTTTFVDTLADSFVIEEPALALDNDAPVTSTLPVPITAALGTPVTAGSLQSVLPTGLAGGFFSANQFITVGTGATQETIYIQSTSFIGGFHFTAYFQFAHSATEQVVANTSPNTPMNLMAIAFDTAWVAGDPNNPHILYYSKQFNPEAFPPENQLEVGKPDDPIMGVIKFRGLLYVMTLSAIYAIYLPQGATPQVYPTAEVTYGLVANFGFCVGNGEIKYQAADGIRRFSGGASQLMTLNVDWLETGQTFGPVIPADPKQFSSTLMEYFNREMYVSYIGTDTLRHRLIWSDDFQRFRNDDIRANALFVEQDPTPKRLLYSDTNGNIFQDRVNNFDDGGFSGGIQIKNPIPVNCQLPFLDQKKPKFQKNYQEFMIDIDPQGQTLTISLVFNNGAGPTLVLGTVNNVGRQKVNFNILNGDGQLAYNVSVVISGNVTAMTTMREFAFKAVMETDTRQSFDSYWIDQDTPEWKIMKQGWFNYVTADGSPISVSIFIDGNMTVPEFTFNLPASQVRQPLKQRFSPIKCRTYRVIGTCPGDFMFYPESFVEVKPVSTNKGYQKRTLSQAA